MSEPKLSEDLQGELGQRLAGGQHAAWREAIQRSEALEARLSKMEEALTKIAGAGEPLDEAAYHPADAVWMRTDAREALAEDQRPASEQ